MMREQGMFKAITEYALLYSLVITAKFDLFARKKNTKNWGKLREQNCLSKCWRPRRSSILTRLLARENFIEQKSGIWYVVGVWIQHSLNQNKDAFHCCFRSNNNKSMKDGSFEANISCHYIRIFFALFRRAKYPSRYCTRCTQAHFYAAHLTYLMNFSYLLRVRIPIGAFPSVLGLKLCLFYLQCQQ